MERLEKLCRTVGREHLVLDLSCRKRGDAYYIVTDRWQNFTEEKVDSHTLNLLAGFCDEFLIHAVDVEGKIRESRRRWSDSSARGPKVAKGYPKYQSPTPAAYTVTRISGCLERLAAAESM